MKDRERFEDELKDELKEGWRELKDGLKEGLEQGLKEGLEEGKEGLKQGLKEGREGLKQGLEEMKVQLKERKRSKKEEFSDLGSQIRRLKRAERELKRLKPPEDVFAVEILSIRGKLKQPAMVDEVEQELAVTRSIVGVLVCGGDQLDVVLLEESIVAGQAVEVPVETVDVVDKVEGDVFVPDEMAYHAGKGRSPVVAAGETGVNVDVANDVAAFLGQFELLPDLGHQAVVVGLEDGGDPAVADSHQPAVRFADPLPEGAVEETAPAFLEDGHLPVTEPGKGAANLDDVLTDFILDFVLGSNELIYAHSGSSVY